jgi:membrane associated rhomboid family serine protease
MKTLYAPQDGLYVSQGTIFILLAWFFICLIPAMQVANGAHGVGLAMGVALGYAPQLFRQRQRR